MKTIQDLKAAAKARLSKSELAALVNSVRTSLKAVQMDESFVIVLAVNQLLGEGDTDSADHLTKFGYDWCGFNAMRSSINLFCKVSGLPPMPVE